MTCVSELLSGNDFFLYSLFDFFYFTDVVLYDGRQATIGASEYKTDLTTHPNRFISAQFARILAGQGHLS